MTKPQQESKGENMELSKNCETCRKCDHIDCGICTCDDPQIGTNDIYYVDKYGCPNWTPDEPADSPYPMMSW